MNSILKCCAFLLCTVILHAFPTPNVTIFSNGLTLVTVNDPSATVASSYVFVRTGSIFEDDILGSGASHYLEHLVAGGTTKKHPEDYYNDLIDMFGGAYNAYTTYDHTGYFIHSSSDNVPRVINTLYEWMFFADWTDSEFKREQGVIIKEMERANSNVHRNIYQKIQSVFYIDSPYRHPVIGYKDTFMKLKSNDVKRYYKKTYTPENMVIVVGGNLTKKNVIEIVKSTFGKQAAQASPIRLNNTAPRILSSSSSSFVMKKIKTPRIIIRYPIPSFYDPDIYPLDLLAYIFGNGQQSLFYQEFVVKQKLATSVRVNSITPSYDFGYFEIHFESISTPSIIVSKTQQLLDKYKTSKFNKKQLSRAKTQKKTEYILGNTAFNDYLQEIGQSMMMGQNPLLLKFYASNFTSISSKELNKVNKTYLNSTQRQVYTFNNTESKPKAAKANSTQPITVTPLNNGIKLINVNSLNDDIVSVTIRLSGGIEQETKETNGIGYLSSLLIGKSTKKYSRNKFQKIFENRGARIGASMGHNSITYQLVCTKDDAKELIPNFINGLTQLSVDTNVFEESKTQLLNSIKKTNESWFEDSFKKLKTSLIPDKSIYSKPLKGSIETVDKLTPKMIETYVKKRLSNSPMQIVVLAKQPLLYKKIILKKINKLPNRSNKQLPTITLLKEEQLKATIEQPMGVIMTVMPIKHIESLNDYLRMQLIDALLSGMSYPSGLLHKRLRGQELVYVVHTLRMKLGNNNMLLTYALTDKKNVSKVTKIIKKSVNDIKENITKKQLDLAKAQVLFNFQNNRQDIDSKINSILTHYELFGEVHNEKDIIDTLSSISKQDIQTHINATLNSHYIMEINKKSI